MKVFLYIFLGGGLGSMIRFIISKLLPVSEGVFPWTTLLANFIGCLFIGLLMGWAIRNDTLRSDFYLFAAVGFCGGLTTFSTFSIESLHFLKTGDYNSFISYVFLSLTGGIIFVLLGFQGFKLLN
jgi:CrcB protein|tara:strand:- start:3705 stop:4079 length:375 start_codon:yes stop_codon:yes gene_type:complete